MLGVGPDIYLTLCPSYYLRHARFRGIIARDRSQTILKRLHHSQILIKLSNVMIFHIVFG